MKLLVAYDGSELSKKAVLEVKNQAVEAEDKEVHIVSVLEPNGPLTQPIISRDLRKEMMEEFNLEMEKIKQELGEVNGRILTDVMISETEDNPGQAICAYAERENIDLILIGNRGLGNVKRFFLGSVSNNVVQHSPCPVLVMK
ncbi:universal stress protein [Thalassobacillus hwangdonensis]|uniref:Universal stress protein n=1 Tax=Thalassobacillus hwangdonensis TaxID=546108 RepID=A0ABW3L0G9_9BACI